VRDGGCVRAAGSRSGGLRRLRIPVGVAEEEVAIVPLVVCVEVDEFVHPRTLVGEREFEK
jgi:hypothetical protein